MRKTLDNIIEKIIEDAKAHLKNTGDDKYFLKPDMFLIIAKSAITEDGILEANRKQCGGGYVHQVTYKGIVFITASDERIELEYEK
ncbi:MAG: hypothetical protein K6T16_01840 [Candidatus Pacearchaeota archaeon]|nr:hypothetical protein [Candidatus Pacearchaeota archaeon]